MTVDLQGGDAIFLNVRGGRLRGDSISAIFAHYRRAAGLNPDLTVHCLRHTFGTILREWGELERHRAAVGPRRRADVALYDHLGSNLSNGACWRSEYIICVVERETIGDFALAR